MKEFFKGIASEENENIDYSLLSRQILIPPKKTFSFLQKYGDLYNFWTNALLGYTNSDDIKSQQVESLNDLMNGFAVYKKIEKPKNESNYKAEDLYLILLGNLNKTVNDIFLKTLTDKYNEKIYLQAKILFNLREKIFKKLFNNTIIKNDSDESDMKKVSLKEQN